MTIRQCQEIYSEGCERKINCERESNYERVREFERERERYWECEFGEIQKLKDFVWQS